MATSKNRTLRVRILVKAFPQPSKAHEETVCCAGISEDGTELLRLFPIRFRRLPKEHQFERFDLVEMTATKASDPRPESYRVDEASIRLIERSTLTNEAKVRLWQPFISPSLKQLHEDNRAANRSLGIIRPDPGSIKFLVKPAKDANAEDRDFAEQVRQMQQSSLLEDPLTPLEKPEFAFSYRYTSAGKHEHNHPRLGSAGGLPSVQASLRRRCARSPEPHVRGDDPGQQPPLHHGHHGRPSANIHRDRPLALSPRPPGTR
jgi:hypothetical protein